jgi:hypothetical protein
MIDSVLGKLICVEALIALTAFENRWICNEKKHQEAPLSDKYHWL